MPTTQTHIRLGSQGVPRQASSRRRLCKPWGSASRRSRTGSALCLCYKASVWSVQLYQGQRSWSALHRKEGRTIHNHAPNNTGMQNQREARQPTLCTQLTSMKHEMITSSPILHPCRPCTSGQVIRQQVRTTIQEACQSMLVSKRASNDTGLRMPVLRA